MTQHIKQARARDALVVIHPYATAKGPRASLLDMADLISSWVGPVFALMDRGGNCYASLHGTHFLDSLFDRTNAAEERGEERRIPADPDLDQFETAIERLLQLTPKVGDFLITGMSLEEGCTTAARLLADAGRMAEVDATALCEEDLLALRLSSEEEDDLIRDALLDLEDA